jgi:hypothetical protein
MLHSSYNELDTGEVGEKRYQGLPFLPALLRLCGCVERQELLEDCVQVMGLQPSQRSSRGQMAAETDWLAMLGMTAAQSVTSVTAARSARKVLPGKQRAMACPSAANNNFYIFRFAIVICKDGASI